MKPWDVIHSNLPAGIVAVVLGLHVIGSDAAAHAQEAAASAPPASSPSWIDRVPIPIELKGLPAEPTGLCEDKPGGPAWLDRMQAGLYRTMCHAAARFDGFFGNARFDDEYQATYGSIAVGALWDERDHWEPSLRFRVRLHLPQLSQRFNGFIGRVDPEEYVTELRDDFDTLPRQFRESNWGAGSCCSASEPGSDGRSRPGRAKRRGGAR